MVILKPMPHRSYYVTITQNFLNLKKKKLHKILKQDFFIYLLTIGNDVH